MRSINSITPYIILLIQITTTVVVFGNNITDEVNHHHPKNRFCALTRTHNEDAHIQSFLDWYILLGFSKILLIQNDKGDLIKHLHSDVIIVIKDITEGANKNPDSLIGKYSKQFTQDEGCEWLLVVDSDEFLLLNQHDFTGIADFVDQKEKMYGKGYLDAIAFRWATIENTNKYCYGNSFMQMLNDFYPNIYWNVMIKSMVRVKRLLIYGNSHYPTFKKDITVPQVYLESKLHSDLKMEAGYNFFSNFTFFESSLIHIHTRSLSDIIIKSLTSGFTDKTVKNKNELLTLILGGDLSIFANYNLTNYFDMFVYALGRKATILLMHMNEKKNYCFNVSHLLSPKMASTFTHLPPICNNQLEVKKLHHALCHFIHNTTIRCEEIIEKYEHFANNITLEYIMKRKVCETFGPPEQARFDDDNE